MNGRVFIRVVSLAEQGISCPQSKAMEDYVSKYTTARGFNIPRLLNDDFWVAIKLLVNAGCYVSASKLLMSFIDSISYVAYGESSGAAFRRWLENYVDIQSLGIGSDELWEHRNSLLHMTNLDSRKVSAGSVKRLVAFIGPLPNGAPREDAGEKFFDLLQLIRAVIHGCEKYLGALNSNPSLVGDFIKRYDMIVSDARYIQFELEEGS